MYPDASNLYKGGYIMSGSSNADIVIFSTGSEVWIALDVRYMLVDKGHNVKVVNLSCWELFEEQDNDYQKDVLGCNNDALLVSVESGITNGWQKFTGRNG